MTCQSYGLTDAAATRTSRNGSPRVLATRSSFLHLRSSQVRCTYAVAPRARFRTRALNRESGALRALHPDEQGRLMHDLHRRQALDVGVFASIGFHASRKLERGLVSGLRLA